ncbi:hypothetical protein LCGC14_1461430 [marine sediment metagenome]|uniref:Uncharacterized protein n=1 Tax=marine sediment metagenome TaxID=412755 RepID=A0A0F9MH09_9ZZZZ
MIESVTTSTPGPGIWRTTVKFNSGRKITVSYLNLPADEIKMQHALGTALWHVSMYRSRSSKIWFIVPVIAPTPISAIIIAEKHYIGSIAYQVVEVLDT